MRDVTLVTLNSLRIKCRIRRPLNQHSIWRSLLPKHIIIVNIFQQYPFVIN